MTCCSRDNYEDMLSIRLREIEKLELYDNSFVVYSEADGYGSTFPRWKSDLDYYQDDMVIDDAGKMYRAIVDSKSKEPVTSQRDWQLIPWMHPYLFLRDTAKVEDLKKLLANTHPYIRAYAFAALANQDVDGLYDVILDNLADTTRMTQMTSDYGFDVCPADLMISYKLDDLNKADTVVTVTLDTKVNSIMANKIDDGECVNGPVRKRYYFSKKFPFIVKRRIRTVGRYRL